MLQELLFGIAILLYASDTMQYFHINVSKVQLVGQKSRTGARSTRRAFRKSTRPACCGTGAWRNDRRRYLPRRRRPLLRRLGAQPLRLRGPRDGEPRLDLARRARPLRLFRLEFVVTSGRERVRRARRGDARRGPVREVQKRRDGERVPAPLDVRGHERPPCCGPPRHRLTEVPRAPERR